MEKPESFRTSDGRVFHNGVWLTLHNGFWWWDVSCAIAPEGAEQNLPIWDEPKETRLDLIPRKLTNELFQDLLYGKADFQ